MKFQIESDSPRWLTNSKYNNIVDTKNLTLTNHGLAMRIILPLQCAPEMKRQNIFPEFHFNCTFAEIHQSQISQTVNLL